MSGTLSIADFATRLRGLITGPPGQGWTTEGRPALPFSQMAGELFALQYAHNASYRRFCEARGVSSREVVRWDQIPAMPTSGFKELEVSCLPVSDRTQVFHSSGTTGQSPSRHFHNPASLALYGASLTSWFESQVFAMVQPAPDAFRLAILTPPPAAAPHSSLVFMFDTLRRKLGRNPSAFLGQVGEDGSWEIDLEATRGTLEAASAAGRPVMILGTAFSFVHLLDFLAVEDRRFELPRGSLALETGGYKGRSRSLPKAELHRRIAQSLGIPSDHIICEYGMSELSSQAYAGAADRGPGLAARGFQFPPWARAQIISAETGAEVGEGETGLVRIFDLANAYSVLAVQTEDLAIRRGTGFELLGRAIPAEPRGCSLLAV